MNDKIIVEQQPICTLCPACQSAEEHEQRKHVDALVRLRETFVDSTPEFNALCYAIERIDWDNEDNEAPPANRHELEATLVRLRGTYEIGTPQYDALSYAVTPPWSLSPVADCEPPEI